METLPTTKKQNLLVYCRVSTEIQAQQGESLESQEKFCRLFAERNNYNVIKVFREVMSGRKDDRPQLNNLIKYIQQNPGQIDYVLVLKLDRLTREGIPGFYRYKKILSELNVQIIDTQSGATKRPNRMEKYGFNYAFGEEDDIIELMQIYMARKEVGDIEERMLGAQIKLTEEGWKVGAAQDGFINQRVYDIHGKKRMIMVADPDRAKYFIEMFKLRSAGNHTDEQIVNKINEMGFTSPIRNKRNSINYEIIAQTGGNPLTVKQFQKYIKNPIYCGVLKHEWGKHIPTKTKYDGLVSIETFNMANRGKVSVHKIDETRFKILYDYADKLNIKRRKKQNSAYPYKNVILCTECGKKLTASSSKGKSGRTFPYYHCSRGHKYTGLSKKELEQRISNFAESLKFNFDSFKRLEVFLVENWKKRQVDVLEENKQLNNFHNELLLQRQQIINSFPNTQNPSLIKGLEEKMEALNEKIADVASRRAHIELQEQELQEFIRYVHYLMEHPTELLLNTANIPALEALYSIVFEKLPTVEEITNGTPKLSFVLQQKETPPIEESLIAPAVG